MKRSTLLLALFCLFTQWSMAQAPKWLDKSKKAVFSIITYDKNDKILNTGNGFFVTENGAALSDYALFKGAERAVVVDSDGKQMPVDAILGANSMYDIVKFRVNTGGKKVTALPVASAAPAADSDMYLLGYSTQKDKLFTAGKVKEVSNIGDGHQYYTLTMKLDDKMVSCPATTTDGQVFGLAQKSSGKDTATICYAVGVSYGMTLSVSALSLSDTNLNSIGIKKGIPETEDQALVFLYMASTQAAPEEYAKFLDEYIAQYPNSVDGYLQRANNYVYTATDDAGMDKAAADVQRAMSVATKKDNMHFNFAKLIYTYKLTHSESSYKDWTLDKALSEIRAAIAIDPLPIYIQTEGDILFANKDYAGAFACYEKVTQTNMSSPAAFFSAAKSKELMGADVKEVLALVDSCIAHCATPINSADASYLLERARLYMETEQYRPAMIDYDAYYNAVKGQVNDVFYYYREQASFQAKQFQRALDDIYKAIEIDPKNVVYRAELAVINIRVGRYEDAVKAMQETIAFDPAYAEGYRLLGIAQIQLKQQAEACISFAKARELGDPNVDTLIEKHCK